MGLSASAPWLSFYGNTPTTLRYPSATMHQLVRAAAKKYPANIAHTFMGKKTTYREFVERIDDAAKGLTALGITKGDQVTICMPNCPQALECFYGLNRIGAIPNMIHPLSAPQEIAFYLDMSKSKAILTLDQFYEKVAGVAGDATILIAKIKDALPFPLSTLYPLTKIGQALRHWLLRIPRRYISPQKQLS